MTVDTLRREADNEAAVDRFVSAIERLAPERALLAQTGDRCAMLDVEAPECALHKAGGLGALPMQCRNFPRSVVDTDAGVEVAFHLDCPTVSRYVASEPAPFRWVEDKTWSYPLFARVERDVVWTADERRPFSELESLRRRWWDELSTRGVHGEIVEVVDAMVTEPTRPDSRACASIVPSAATLHASGAQLARAFLEHLPGRGACYAESASLITPALESEHTVEALSSFSADALSSFSCAAGLLIAHAGVHDGRTIDAGIRLAGRQVALAMGLFQATRELQELSEQQRLADALCAAAHMSRWQELTTLEWAG